MTDRLFTRLAARGHRFRDGDWALAKTTVSSDAGWVADLSGLAGEVCSR